VLKLVDDLDDDAALVGAANTIVNDDGRLTAHNTDLAGFLRSLRTLIDEGARGLGCLVLGAGGAARAVVAGLARDEADTVWVANRTLEKAEALCQDAQSWGSTKFIPIGLEEAASVGANCELLVNATSLGLPDSVKQLPLDVDTLHSGQVLVDLVYASRQTELVRAARSRGLAAIDGKEMLIQQAALSYTLWTGLSAPIGVMRGSIDDC
jgi:shikimate dehydrogenase